MESGMIGKKIKFYRLQRGLTQMALADSIGVSYQQLQKYENEKNQITLQRLSIIAKALDIPLSMFVGDLPANRFSDGGGKAGAHGVRSRDERKLVELFGMIKSPGLRRTVLRLVQGIAEQQESG